MNSRPVARVLATLALVALSSPVAPALAQSGTCANCGTVESIRYIEEKGKGSGLGMAAGGVVGGVLGHQIGSGRGNTVATIAGAAGGAYVGNEVEKNSKKTSYYNIAIRMDNGSTRTLHYNSQPSAREGRRRPARSRPSRGRSGPLRRPSARPRI